MVQIRPIGLQRLAMASKYRQINIKILIESYLPIHKMCQMFWRYESHQQETTIQYDHISVHSRNKIKNKGTLLSPTFKIEEKKVPLVL